MGHFVSASLNHTNGILVNLAEPLLCVRTRLLNHYQVGDHRLLLVEVKIQQLGFESVGVPPGQRLVEAVVLSLFDVLSVAKQFQSAVTVH